ncbi:Steroid 17-alpha-hydroxylase/17,20 lyase [Holothuria leucospilota]|uniref:Steroid 17-alpha-hydroxylase/17,20 lyase n=1 Tax=Holothuria leucospilota TaxID=206669 RepID=A0A9Q1CP94_HOLLE|nr:Steroid 17-alpha-hydroxylase/17,20 lyase [Holothuria leucospilota]
MDEFLGAIRKEVKEHRARYDGGEPKDLIEMLLQARQEMEDEGSDDMKMITETRIIQTVANVFDGMELILLPMIQFLSGIDSAILTLLWCIGLLVQHPNVQAKVAAEVDKVVGRDRLPCLNDRDNLPYSTATLFEVMRYSSIAPLSLPHATSKEVQIGSYTLPKGTWVLVNLYSMHFDEKLWDQPHKFKPEHFLNATGEVRLLPEGFMPFSAGRRVCVGESVAKAELFLLFSWLFHRFKFAKAPGMEGTDYSESVSVLLGSMVIENDVVVEKRF